MKTAHGLGDLEARLAGGERMTAADAERVFQCPDLVSVGVVGEQARRARTGSRVTFGRVMAVGDALPSAPGDAGEVRIEGTPASVEGARSQARQVVAWAQGRPVTAFTLADLSALCGGDLARLTVMAAELASDGVTAVASVALDGPESADDLAATVRAVLAGGLGAWRLVVERADGPRPLECIERACRVQELTGAVKAFAPLARVEPIDAPSTGYDNVKTVAAARLRCQDIECIQVDWPLHGPKLAQVAITFGANDIDGVAAVDIEDLGPRRAPVEDICRQIRAAGAEPAERDARYVLRN